MKIRRRTMFEGLLATTILRTGLSGVALSWLPTEAKAQVDPETIIAAAEAVKKIYDFFAANRQQAPDRAPVILSELGDIKHRIAKLEELIVAVGLAIPDAVWNGRLDGYREAIFAVFKDLVNIKLSLPRDGSMPGDARSELAVTRSNIIGPSQALRDDNNFDRVIRCFQSVYIAMTVEDDILTLLRDSAATSANKDYFRRLRVTTLMDYLDYFNRCLSPNDSRSITAQYQSTRTAFVQLDGELDQIDSRVRTDSTYKPNNYSDRMTRSADSSCTYEHRITLYGDKVNGYRACLWHQQIRCDTIEPRDRGGIHGGGRFGENILPITRRKSVLLEQSTCGDNFPLSQGQCINVTDTGQVPVAEWNAKKSTRADLLVKQNDLQKLEDMARGYRDDCVKRLAIAG